MSSNNFYSANANSNANANANAQRAPPVPPPRQATAAASARGTTAASVRGTTAAKKASRPRQTTYQSNRATAPTVLVGDRNKSSLSGVRKAPVASRPVGSYYNTTSASTAAPTVASTSTNNSAWDDWSSPADTSTATTTATATTNQHSSWAGSNNNSNNNNSNPVTTATTTTIDGDWYSAGGSAATATATTASTGAMYTSSGFNNNSAMQPQSQPQQQQPGSGFYQNNTMSQEQQQQQQPFLSGAMDSSAPTMMAMNANNNNINNGNTAGTGAMPSFSMFMPSASTQQQQDACTYSSFEDEAPLLEELGINIQHILLKTKAVVFPFSRFGGDQIDPTVICQDGDLPGPVALLLLLGGEMVLTGKLQFGYIYIYALFGCIAMTLVVNLMSPNDAVSFWTVTSIMGYSLLPVNILALVKIVIMNLIHLQTFGNILGGLTVIWSTVASTRLLELGCGLRSQRYLIAYPLLLFYSAFVMMTIL